MKPAFSYHKIPLSRIATFDVLSIGLKKHHVSAFLEFDVTEGREKLRHLKRTGASVSFNAWILKLIGVTLEKHKEAAAFLVNKHKLVAFDDINISMVVEKEINGKKVPIPLVIEKANEKNVNEIALEIESSRNQVLTENEIVLHSKPKPYERLYYKLPGFLRRTIWRAMLGHPKFAFKKMGNVAVTSLGMMGRINGWFIPISVHPVSFGIGSIIKKAVVINDEIKVREILNMTILLDHDVIDGAPMVRFIKDLTNRIENGEEL
jgi:pyruvate/2-oxoglutarate dehydrogenase complex dihydrolipoamide acyltransferase (E2) component